MLQEQVAWIACPEQASQENLSFEKRCWTKFNLKIYGIIGGISVLFHLVKILKADTCQNKGVPQMLNKAITYKTLVRIAGILCLLWAAFLAFRVATIPVYVGPDAPNQQFTYLIVTNFGFALGFMIEQGILWYIVAGVLLLVFSTSWVRMAYWSIQIAVWLAGISIWYQVNRAFAPPSQDPSWMIITIVCSLVLLALYKPIIFLLTKIMRPSLQSRPQVKDERLDVEELKQQVQRYRSRNDP